MFVCVFVGCWFFLVLFEEYVEMIFCGVEIFFWVYWFYYGVEGYFVVEY